MPDRSRRPGADGELPPDPWAGLVDPQPPPRPAMRDHGWGDPVWSASADAPPGDVGGPGWHPSAGPQRSRSLLQHPVIWVAVTALALLMLVTAFLEPRPAPPPADEPSPDSVSALPG